MPSTLLGVLLACLTACGQTSGSNAWFFELPGSVQEDTLQYLPLQAQLHIYSEGLRHRPQRTALAAFVRAPDRELAHAVLALADTIQPRRLGPTVLLVLEYNECLGHFSPDETLLDELRRVVDRLPDATARSEGMEVVQRIEQGGCRAPPL
jgi:hypothetical protein